MGRFMWGMCVAALLWISWVGVALYTSAVRTLPTAPPIQLAAANDWCDFTPSGPLINRPRHNYDYQLGAKRRGSAT